MQCISLFRAKHASAQPGGTPPSYPANIETILSPHKVGVVCDVCRMKWETILIPDELIRCPHNCNKSAHSIEKANILKLSLTTSVRAHVPAAICQQFLGKMAFPSLLPAETV